MPLRIATLADFERIHALRMAVLENRLSDPSRITVEHYRKMLENRGRGWVFEVDDEIVGFGIADATTRSLWALFVKPGFERRGIGHALHDVMVDWLFSVGDSPLWLTTDPHTRAARFYAAAGWQLEGTVPNGELRFVLGRRRQAEPA